jgi:hypothetical protein
VFKSIKVNHQRGRINIFFAHAGFGGRVLQHGVFPPSVGTIIAMAMWSAPIMQVIAAMRQAQKKRQGFPCRLFAE